MLPSPTCLGFHVPCNVMFLGIGAVAMAFVIFIGTVWLVLSAVLGRTMAGLLVLVCFSAWMIIQSSLWLFGFWSQGLETPTNLGPRGAEPTWTPIEASLNPTSTTYPVISQYPRPPWSTPTVDQVADVQTVTGAAQTFLADEANTEMGKQPDALGALQATDFTVENLRFTTSGDTNLAAVRAFYNGGGPDLTILLYYDTGSVPRYSYMFLAGSILVFAISLPMLDRAEKKRKAILTGGEAPAWYGPA
jgi:hypothetical protein